jgi:hypothetical protein
VSIARRQSGYLLETWSPVATPSVKLNCCLPWLIIRLIIQTIRRDPSGSVQIDDASNVSRPDPTGADQTDAEHRSTDLAVGGSNPSQRASKPQSTAWGYLLVLAVVR